MASVSHVARGVPPIRAGQGHSFFLRRLHSLSGIIPVGAFLVEHFISNAFATNGPWAYADQVKFLTGLPFVPVLEIVGIYIPLLYHALYGGRAEDWVGRGAGIDDAGKATYRCSAP